MAPRYAVYYTPDPKGALWRFGSGIIGYDANLAMDVPMAVPEGFDVAGWTQRTAEPRRYGFHATLKAPFYLATGVAENELLGGIERIASSIPAACELTLGVAALGSFIALLPLDDEKHVSALASEVVVALESFRAPLEAADRERRLSTHLTARQRAYLDSYGYPYVLEEFRFHMTLTDKLPASELRTVQDKLKLAFIATVPSAVIRLDHLTVLRQEHHNGRFRVIARFSLNGRRQTPAGSQ